jgi:hypothetical protein
MPKQQRQQHQEEAVHPARQQPQQQQQQSVAGEMQDARHSYSQIIGMRCITFVCTA